MVEMSADTWSRPAGLLLSADIRMTMLLTRLRLGPLVAGFGRVSFSSPVNGERNGGQGDRGAS